MYAGRMNETTKAELAKYINEHSTDQLWSRAVELIRSNMDLSTENHYIGGNGAWSITRKHKTFIEQMLDNLSAPSDGEAAIVGGMPGAGKSKMLPAFFNPSQFFVIDPDEIKRWLVDNDLAPEIPGLTPMETAPLLHVESTVLAKKLSERLLADKINVIWPLTFSSADPVKNRIGMAKKAGYKKVHGAYVQVSLNTSTSRVKSRYIDGMKDFANGHGPGGRFIDLEAISRNSSPELFRKFSAQFDYQRVLNNDMDLL